MTRRLRIRTSAQFVHRAHQVLQITPQPVELPHDVCVTRLQRLQTGIEARAVTGVLEIDIGWVNGNYQRVLFHSVRATSADRLREMVAPRRRLALVCFLHQAWRDTLDQAVDMYARSCSTAAAGWSRTTWTRS